MSKPQNDGYFEVLIMAAGLSSRMVGEDKLLKKKNKTTMLSHVVQQAINSQVGHVRVILGHNFEERARTLLGLPIAWHFCDDYAKGLSASIKCGLNRVSDRIDGVIISLSDMPLVTSMDYQRLRNSYSPINKKEICQAITESGVRGHPVLFGKRFFKCLKQLSGDIGGKNLIKKCDEFVVEVPTEHNGAILDINRFSDLIKWN